MSCVQLMIEAIDFDALLDQGTDHLRHVLIATLARRNYVSDRFAFGNG